MFLLLMALVGHISTAAHSKKIERVKRGGKFLKNRDLNRISLYEQKWALRLYTVGLFTATLNRERPKLTEIDRNRSQSTQMV